MLRVRIMIRMLLVVTVLGHYPADRPCLLVLHGWTDGNQYDQATPIQWISIDADGAGSR